MKQLLFTLALLTTLGANASMKFFDSSGVQLGIKSEFECYTGITCTVVAGKLRVVSSPTLATALSLKAADTVDSSITLQADNSDDSGDDWKLASVASGNAFTLSNDASGSQVVKVSVAASTGNVTLVGGLIGDGGDAFVGFLQSQNTVTTTTATAAQCGSTFINSGAGVVTLPEASTVLGCRYTFVVGNASNFDVNPADGTDTIQILTNAAGDAIRNATLGSSIMIQAVSADAWAVIGKEQGTWSDVN